MTNNINLPITIGCCWMLLCRNGVVDVGMLDLTPNPRFQTADTIDGGAGNDRIYGRGGEAAISAWRMVA